MTTMTEGRHTAEFVLSEAEGQRSRENGTVASGQDLAAGTVVQDNGSGKLIACSGTLNTAGDLVTAVAGVILAKADASAGDVDVAYIARDAEVNGNTLTYPTESTAGGEKAATKASLTSLGIIVRE